MSDYIKFNLSAPITNMTSYGIVALNIIENSNCKTFPIQRNNESFSDKVIKSLDDTDFDPNLPSVRLYHQFNLAESIGRGDRIGFPIFELDKFNKSEIAHLKSCDKLLVCSEWAKKIIKDNKIDVPTFVVPLGVNRSIFKEVNYTPPKHIFFTTGKLEIRKGHDEIVQAFNKEFTPKDNVELWMSVHNIFLRPEQISSQKNEWLNTHMGKSGLIKFVGPFRTQQDLSRIMNMSSCGVFPSKAEGWGMGTLEMLSCGKQVIATNYSGHTEYLNNSNSILIDPTGLEPAIDNKWFFGQGSWAKFDIDELCCAMRKSYNIGHKINNSGIETAKKFSWQNTVSQIYNALN